MIRYSQAKKEKALIQQEIYEVFFDIKHSNDKTVTKSLFVKLDKLKEDLSVISHVIDCIEDFT